MLGWRIFVCVLKNWHGNDLIQYSVSGCACALFRKRCSKNYSKFTREHPYQSAISIKLQSNFTEIALRHECSPVNLLYISETPLLTGVSETIAGQEAYFRKKTRKPWRVVLRSFFTVDVHTLFKRSHPEVFCKIGVLKNFAKFRGKHLCQALAQMVFPREFCEILDNNFFYWTPPVAAYYFCRKTDSKEKGVSFRCIKIASFTMTMLNLTTKIHVGFMDLRNFVCAVVDFTLDVCPESFRLPSRCYLSVW